APHDLFRSVAVIVPTRGAAWQLGRLLPADAAPEMLTRDELYANLNARLAAPRRTLAPVEREVMLHAAADEAIAAGDAPPYDVRPGLVAEMLRFYDQLRRQGQSVQRFDELIAERLQG